MWSAKVQTSDTKVEPAVDQANGRMFLRRPTLGLKVRVQSIGNQESGSQVRTLLHKGRCDDISAEGSLELVFLSKSSDGDESSPSTLFLQ